MKHLRINWYKINKNKKHEKKFSEKLKKRFKKRVLSKGKSLKELKKKRKKFSENICLCFFLMFSKIKVYITIGKTHMLGGKRFSFA